MSVFERKTHFIDDLLYTFNGPFYMKNLTLPAQCNGAYKNNISIVEPSLDGTLLSVFSLSEPQFVVHEVKQLIAVVTRHSGQTICTGSIRGVEIFRGDGSGFFFSRVGKRGRGESGRGAAAVCAGCAKLVVLRDRLRVTCLLRHRSNVAGMQIVEVWGGMIGVRMWEGMERMNVVLCVV